MPNSLARRIADSQKAPGIGTDGFALARRQSWICCFNCSASFGNGAVLLTPMRFPPENPEHNGSQ